MFERVSDGKLSVCKITFGAEPKDYEIYEFVLKNYYRLVLVELVRYQKQGLSMAAGAEEVIYSATQMLSAERRNHARQGELSDIPGYSIPYPQNKKIADLKNHIWGL